MKTQLKSLGLALSLGSMLSACAPASSDLEVRDLPQGRVSKAGNVAAEVKHEPKVDILFVIDTSGSMGTHQENLEKNIDKFVEAFKQHAEVDFHIGAVSAWDSVRYGGAQPVVQAPMPIGKLRPVKNNGQPVAGPQFVTRSEGFEKILGGTLKLGIEPRMDDSGKDLGGPEYEELFSPILPALGSQNEGFYRPDAHLAVVFITDAEDATMGKTAKMVKSDLVALKGGKESLVSVHGALAFTCSQVDKSLIDGETKKINRPVKLEELIEITKGKAVDLCGKDKEGKPTFGRKLGEIGRVIQEKTSAQDVKISLSPSLPSPGTIVVTYNGQALKQGRDWSYDATYNRVEVHVDQPAIAKQPGGTIGVEFTPVDPTKLSKGRVIPVGS